MTKPKVLENVSLHGMRYFEKYTTDAKLSQTQIFFTVSDPAGKSRFWYWFAEGIVQKLEAQLDLKDTNNTQHIFVRGKPGYITQYHGVAIGEFDGPQSHKGAIQTSAARAQIAVAKIERDSGFFLVRLLIYANNSNDHLRSCMLSFDGNPGDELLGKIIWGHVYPWGPNGPVMP
jgi:hypothetical protein